MPECEYCLLQETGEIILETERTVAAMHPKSPVKGQAVIIPKKHFTILEQVPEDLAGELFNAANQVSAAIFESLGASGTNILVENGTAAGQKVPHVSLNIIPRNEEDGLDLAWEPKQLTEDEMSTAELQLKDDSQNAETGTPEKNIKMEQNKPETFSEQEDYRIKQLKRTP